MVYLLWFDCYNFCELFWFVAALSHSRFVCVCVCVCFSVIIIHEREIFVQQNDIITQTHYVLESWAKRRHRHTKWPLLALQRGNKAHFWTRFFFSGLCQREKERERKRSKSRKTSNSCVLYAARICSLAEK